MLAAWQYCTYAGIKERLNLAGVGFDTTTYTSSTIAPLQINSQNKINGHLEGFYTVPFTVSVPDLINELSEILTTIEVYDMIVGYDQFKSNQTIDYYKKMVGKTIEDLKKRKLTLGLTHEIDASQYFIGNTTKKFDFSDSTTTWFDID